MRKVLAAIDSSAAARPVLEVAVAVAELWEAEPYAFHVREDGVAATRAQCSAMGLPLQVVSGPTVERLVAAARPVDVAAVVIGARRTPGGRRPAGRTALEVITSLRKPLVVVPPHFAGPVRLGRLLIPLDGTATTALALQSTMELAHGCELGVVLLHVYEESSLPPFNDQPQHETRTWAEEFIARYCPSPYEVRHLELRVGIPRDHVVRVAAEAGADLIALGWSQDLSPGRAEVVRTTLAESPVPVLLLPVSPTSERQAAPDERVVAATGGRARQ